MPSGYNIYWFVLQCFKKKPWLPLFLIVPGGRSLLARTLAPPVDQEEDDGDDEYEDDDHGDGDDEDEDEDNDYGDEDHSDADDEDGRGNSAVFERGS